jgi:hypothetical protein
MTEFLKFTISSGRIVYINRNYIIDFSYDPAINKTVIGLPGTENYYSIDGDQTQKILEGNKNE